MIPSTPYLLLGPLVLFLPLYLVRRARPWGALLAAAALALETYGCFTLPPDVGLGVLGHTVALGAMARMVLAWIAGGAALLAVGHAIAASDPSPAVFLLPAVSAAGLALAVEPFPLALLAVWIAMLVAIPLFRADCARAGRGVSQFLILTVVSVPAVLTASVLLTRALTASVEEVPPWGSIAILVAIGSAAWLSLAPFQVWGPGLMGSGQPLAAGWVVGILQPLVLVTLAQVMQARPEIFAQPQAQQIALMVSVASVALGAVFAATTRHPGRMLGYTAITAMAPLFFVLYTSAENLSQFHWVAVLGYSAAVILASVGLAGAVRGREVILMEGLAGAAHGRGAALALLLCSAMGLCGLPLGIGFWAHGALRADMPTAPNSALLVFQIAPLAAAFGWWRVLRYATHRREGEPIVLGRAANAVFWVLVGLAVALVVWPTPLFRAAEAFVRALGSL